MHQHTLDLNVETDPRAERLARYGYFAFAAVVGVLLLLNLTGVFKTVWGIDTAAILTLIAGYRTFYNAVDGLLHKRISADLAICIAVIAALWVGEYLAAAEAMLIMLVGEGLEGYATRRTANAIRRFVEQMPRRARVLRDGEQVEVDASALTPGDVMVIRSGERIAADGVVVFGASSIDESTITGEPVPRDKKPGDEVFSGTLNTLGLLHVRVIRAGQETTLARVIRLVEEARERKAPVERLADRWAKYFVPLLLLAGAGTYWFTRDWLRTVSVLIVGCPCALILATPTAMVAAIGALARRGILVRSGTVLQQAAELDTAFFDKTGTVTEGRFEIIRLLPNGIPEEELLRLAAAAESSSDHVLAKVIVAEARARSIVLPEIESGRVVPGRGVECRLGGRTVRAGSAGFLEVPLPAGVLEEADSYGATAVLVADGSRFAGAVLLRDRVRAGSAEAVHQFRHLGIDPISLLTGDRRRAAEAIARVIGITSVEADLLPEQKLTRIRESVAQGHKVVMIGDGLNDAPALAAAHVGIAVRGASDITAEAAGVVYMGHSLDHLPLLITTARRAVRIVWQNIIGFALILNVIAILLAAQGVMGPLAAAFTHQIGSFLVMLNSLRLLTRPREFRLPHFHIRPLLRRMWARRRQAYRPAAITAGILAVLNGFYVIGPGETGVVQRFGRVVNVAGPGIGYKLPWPLDSLTRVSRRVRTAEIGFRTVTGTLAEPATYEWNVTHRAGRFQRKPEESLMLSGDSNMAEVTASIHYVVTRPEDFLFRHADGEALVATTAESAMRLIVASSSLDDILTQNRRAVEERVKSELAAHLASYKAGVEVLRVKLLDVHPSQEAVEAYREVSAAFEEKNRLINEAEGYRNEQVALARGNGLAKLEQANGYTAGRKNRAEGDSSRFVSSEAAFRASPATTETRLYLEAVEQVLAGKKKVIVDGTKGRRHLLLMDDGVEFGPGLLPQPTDTRQPIPPE